jgi:hypothetical protein
VLASDAEPPDGQLFVACSIRVRQAGGGGIERGRFRLAESEVKLRVTAIENFLLLAHVSNDECIYVSTYASSFYTRLVYVSCSAKHVIGGKRLKFCRTSYSDLL